MSPDSNEPPTDDPETKAWSDLIRRAVPAESDDFVRPSAETIDAYLLGTATEEQREEILVQMGLSRAFRREISEAAEELRSLQDPEALARFSAVNVRSRPPDLQQPSWFDRLSGLIWQPSVAYAFAAICLLVAIIPQIQSPGRGDSAGGMTLAWERAERFDSPPRVLGFKRTAARGAGDEEPPLIVEAVHGDQELLLLVPVRRVDGDVDGRYVVSVSGPDDRPIAEREFTSDRLLESSDVPVYLGPQILKEGVLLTVRVTFRDPTHPNDGAVCFGRQIRVRGRS